MSGENEAFISGFHKIPSAHKLRQMSFTELAELLSSCERDSPRFLVVERELRIRIAEDQARVNRRNMLLVAAIAGVFTVVGVVVGAVIRSWAG